MVHDAEMVKNELTFEDQMLEATNTLITGEEPATHRVIHPLSLYQHKNTAVNKLQLSVWQGKEGVAVYWSW